MTRLRATVVLTLLGNRVRFMEPDFPREMSWGRDFHTDPLGLYDRGGGQVEVAVMCCLSHARRRYVGGGDVGELFICFVNVFRACGVSGMTDGSLRRDGT